MADLDQAILNSANVNVHSRRSHRKSRAGCKTCKQRRVKCDENRNQGCGRCAHHGVECDYLRSSSATSAHIVASRRILRKAEDIKASQDWILGRSKLPQLVNGVLLPASVGGLLDCPAAGMTSSLQALHLFETVTYATVSSPLGQQIVKQSVLGIVMSFPYLMHAVLAVTAAHRQHLLPAHQHPTQYRESKVAESYHWQQTLGLFQAELSKPKTFGLHNMDALLTTCMLLTLHSFGLPRDGQAQSFVLAKDSETGVALTWLKSQTGFRSLAAEFEPCIHETVWLPVFTDSDNYAYPPRLDPINIDSISKLFRNLCNVTSSSTPAENPYFEYMELVLAQLRIEASIESFHKIITFGGRIGKPFFQLLQARDPRALLILCYWLAQMHKIDLWWIASRAQSECVAIVQYLRNCGDSRVQQLLAYPIQTLGIELN